MVERRLRTKETQIKRIMRTKETEIKENEIERDIEKGF